MPDTPAEGRKFRGLNIVDDFRRENPTIEVDTSLPGQLLVRVLEWLCEAHGLPPEIVSGHGPAFTGRALGERACYQWKAKYGGLEVSELVRVKELESENRRLKRMYAELALENGATKGLLKNCSAACAGTPLTT